MKERSRRVLLAFAIMGAVVLVAGGICISIISQMSN